MTKAKRWPTNAEWARLDAIAKANKGINILRPLVRGEEMTSVGIVSRGAQALDILHEIEKLLQEVGPKNR